MTEQSLVDVLLMRAQRTPDDIVYRYLGDGEQETAALSYAQLLDRVRSIATVLKQQSQPGDRALMLYDPGLEFVESFFACLYCGVIGIPLFPPIEHQKLRRLQAIIKDSDPTLILTAQSSKADIQRFLADDEGLASSTLLATDTVATRDGASQEYDASLPPRAEDVAFLQYTSGSTGDPKGVMVTHANLMANNQSMQEAMQTDATSVMVSWVPHFHDLGLIYGILHPLYVGFASVLLPPAAFVQKPVRLLQALSTYGGTISGAPTFGYDLCTEKATDAEIANLDLSPWRIALIGAEPIKVSTLERFSARFAAAGFSQDAFLPAYGMAETTLVVSCKTEACYQVLPVTENGLRLGVLESPNDTPSTNAATTHPQSPATTDATPAQRCFVSSGVPHPDFEVRVVDPETLQTCPPEGVGEIWIGGPSITAGYWQNPEQTREIFQAFTADTGEGPYLRTGDLGALLNNQLYITGRVKEMMIIRGQNYYPADVKATVAQASEALSSFLGAVFSVEDNEGTEQLVVVHELKRTAEEGPHDAVFRAIRNAVASEHGVDVGAIVLTQARSTPRTSSGKIQHRRAKQLYLEAFDALKPLAHWCGDELDPDRAASSATSLTPAQNLEQNPKQTSRLTANQLRDFMTQRIAQIQGVPVDAIDEHAPFRSLGLDSVKALQLSQELADASGVALSPTASYAYPTIVELAAFVGGEPREGAVSSLDAIREPASAQQAQTSSTATDAPQPIAIVGMSCRLPGGIASPEDFWKQLIQGHDLTETVPVSRWDADAYFDEEPGVEGKYYCRRGGFVADIDQFDAGFFGISDREANSLDPQQRLTLELSWEALERANIVPADLNGSRTGVFIGHSGSEYPFIEGAGLQTDGYRMTGHLASTCAGRVSFTLGLRGPCYAIDTACSSSLASMHLACESLRSGESDLALAGGITLMLSPRTFVEFSRLKVSAADGHCKAFADDADGAVWSDGAGLVVLKRLEDAQRDGDHILAVVRGSATNHDGRSAGLTVPFGPAQQQVVQQALANARLDINDIDFIEAHGTGTSLGDPIEANALSAVFATRAEPLWLGSSKSNIGHTMAAAGVAGVIKAVLAMQHRRIPKTLYAESPSQHVDWQNSPLRLARANTPWPNSGRPRRSGVSSFGISGTNAHVVLEEAPPVDETTTTRGLDILMLPLSGKTPEALAAHAGQLKTYLQQHPATSLTDVAYHQAHHRSLFDHRAVIVLSRPSVNDVVAALTAIAAGEEHEAVIRDAAKKPGKCVFVFPGQGGQWLGMGQSLMASEPVFRQALEACNDALSSYVDWSLLDVLQGNDPEYTLERVDVVQPALFSIYVSLAALWRSWGIEPNAVIGHSQGEIAAACVAGALSLSDAACISVTRSRLIADIAGRGSMTMIKASREIVQPLLDELQLPIDIAVVNAPGETVVSGLEEALEVLELRLEQAQLFWRRISVDYASHGSAVEPIRQPMLDALGHLAPRPASVAFYSTTQAKQLVGTELAADYWFENLRYPVRFMDTVQALCKDGYATFVAVSAHPVLAHALKAISDDQHLQSVITTSLQRDTDGMLQMRKNLARLFVQGCPIDWSQHTGSGRCLANLPTYPFQRQRYWPASDDDQRQGIGQVDTGNPLLGAHIRLAAGGGDLFVSDVSLRKLSWVRDHMVTDHAMAPATLMLEFCHAVGRYLQTSGMFITMQDIELFKAWVLTDEKRICQIVVKPPERDGYRHVEFYVECSAAESGENDWDFFGTARLGQPFESLKITFPAADRRCALDIERMHENLSRLGIDYGPLFRGLARAYRDGNYVWGLVETPHVLDASGGGIHPALLDAALQVCWLVDGESELKLSLPNHFGRVELTEHNGDAFWVRAEERADSGQYMTDKQRLTRRFDVMLVDSSGHCFGRLLDLHVTEISRERFERNIMHQAPVKSTLYRQQWQLIDVVTEDSDAWSGVIATHPLTVDTSPVTAQIEASMTADCVVIELPPVSSIEQLTALYRHIITFIKACLAQPHRPHLIWHALAECDAQNSPASLLQGLIGCLRVLRNEYPDWPMTWLETDQVLTESTIAQVMQSPNESALRYRQGQWSAQRLALSDEEATVPQVLRNDGFYLITGGTGALGRFTAHWLATTCGVKHLVLVSRTASESRNDPDWLPELEKTGVEVKLIDCDLGDQYAVDELIRRLQAERPIRGIIHTAGILKSNLMEQIEHADIDTVFAGKVGGAWYLHEASKTLDLDLFVMYSSLSGVLGNLSQAVYAAANQSLDSLAQLRQQQGLPATAIAWGYWTGELAGMASVLNVEAIRRFRQQGVSPIDRVIGASLLPLAFHSKAANVVAAPLNLRRLARWLGAHAPMHLQAILPQESAASAMQWRQLYDQLTENKQPDCLQAMVRVEVGAVLKSNDPSILALKTPFRDLGMDSLMAVEIRNRLANRTTLALAANTLFDYPTIQQLADYLARLIAGDQKRHEVMKPYVVGAQEPIAIIGMACRLPGGIETPDDFWQLLHTGADATETVPEDRWNARAIFNEDASVQGTSYCSRGGFIHGVDQFDAGFFGISGREAEALDPQQRLLLELGWEALERAHILPETLEGESVGVFVGLMGSDYAKLQRGSQALDGYQGIGSAASTAAGRLAYTFGIHGPCMAIDTACSSSLVSLHQACQSLREQECGMGLVGGVSLMLTPDMHIEFCRQRGMAADGRCKAFSDQADGAGWSDGAGMLVLKRLSDAQRDNDPILGVIKGSAINQDGRSAGLTAPNGPAQQSVVRQALANSGLDIDDIDFVEAHGTGTALGDPIEAMALADVFAARTQPLYLGSAKSNLGHTMAAAGITGVIKTLLALKNATLPVTLFADQPSQKIDWQNSPLQLLQENTPWPADHVRRAGVSSFGISGTNAHVVIEQAPEAELADEQILGARDLSLLCLAGASEAALDCQQEKLAAFLGTSDIALSDVAYSLATARSHPRFRRVLLSGCERANDLFASDDLERLQSDAQLPFVGKTAFLFTGQGAQLAGMGRTLYGRESVFTQVLDFCSQRLFEQAPETLMQIMFADVESDQGKQLHQTGITQPALFALEVALAAQWRAWGVQPDVVIGHSIGEVAAACVAGILDISDGLRLVEIRGRMMQALDGEGAMLSVRAPATDIAPFLKAADDVSVAALNGPQNTVLSGAANTIDVLETQLIGEGFRCQRLLVSHAFHSPMMQPMVSAFREAIQALTFKPGEILMISNLGGVRIEPGETLDANYWCDHVLAPVDFLAGAALLEAEGVNTLIELGPRPLLLPMLDACWQGERPLMIASLSKNGDAQHDMLLALSQWYVQGGDVDWPGFYADRRVHAVDIPTYAFVRQRYWVDDASPSVIEGTATGDTLLGQVQYLPGQKLFSQRLTPNVRERLLGHQLFGEKIMPAMGLWLMAEHAARFQHDDDETVQLNHFTLHEPLWLTQSEPQMDIVLREVASGRHLAIYSRDSSADAQWMLHAEAQITARSAGDGSSLQRPTTPASLDGPDFYHQLASQGYQYAGEFQAVQALWHDDECVITQLNIAPPGDSVSLIAALDALLHGCRLLVADPSDTTDQHDGLFVPQSIDSGWFDVAGVVSTETTEATPLWARLSRIDTEQEIANTAVLNIDVFDEQGQAVGVAHGLRLTWVDRDKLRDHRHTPALPTNCLLECIWQPADFDASASSKATATPSTHAICYWELAAINRTELNALSPNTALVIELPTLHQAEEVIHLIQAAVQLVQSLLAAQKWPTVVWHIPAATAATPSNALLRGLSGFIRTLRSEYNDWSMAVIESSEPAIGIDQAIIDYVVMTPDVVEWRWSEGALTQPLMVPVSDEASVSPTPTPREGYVIITGGCGALGRHAAALLASQLGQQQIVLLSRRGPQHPAADEIRQELAELGADAQLIACDVADASALSAVLQQLAETQEGPLTGVIHTAGSLSDNLLPSITDDDVAQVLAAKVLGAWHLHEQTRDIPLDYFVLYGSLASYIGNPSQSVYAAANRSLEGLADMRQQLGLPAQAISWGLWLDKRSEMTGKLDVHDMQRLRQAGILPIDAHLGDQLLMACLNQSNRNLIAAPLDLERLREQSTLRAFAIFNTLLAIPPQAEVAHAGASSWLAQLADLPDDKQARQIQHWVHDIVSEVLKTRVDVDRPLKEHGLDSMGAVEIRNRLVRASGVAMPANILFDYPTVTELGQFLVSERMRVAESASTTTAAINNPNTDNTSDEGLLQQAMQRLKNAGTDAERQQLLAEIAERASAMSHSVAPSSSQEGDIDQLSDDAVLQELQSRLDKGRHPPTEN